LMRRGLLLAVLTAGLVFVSFGWAENSAGAAICCDQCYVNFDNCLNNCSDQTCIDGCNTTLNNCLRFCNSGC
jgi:hypothetical protein